MSLPIDGEVIIVDDDEEFRQNVKSFLDSNKIPCVAFENAASALRFVQHQNWTWKPGLLLTDIVMDGIGGYEFMRRFKELFKEKTPPMIVISKLNSGTDVGEADMAGAAGYMTKPFNGDSLLKVLGRIYNENPKSIVVCTQEIGVKVLSR